MSTKPVYLVAPPGSLRDTCVAALDGKLEFLDPPLRAEALLASPPGIVLVEPEGLDACALVEAAATLVGPEWTLAVLQPGAPPTVRTISLGHPTELDGVARFAAHEGDGSEDLLDLDRVLAEISRARHDINNPLTSALAETQILLLDAPGGEVGEALETVQTQLRRIRDLVAGTRHMRPRR